MVILRLGVLPRHHLPRHLVPINHSVLRLRVQSLLLFQIVSLPFLFVRIPSLWLLLQTEAVHDLSVSSCLRGALLRDLVVRDGDGLLIFFFENVDVGLVVVHTHRLGGYVNQLLLVSKRVQLLLAVGNGHLVANWLSKVLVIADELRSNVLVNVVGGVDLLRLHVDEVARSGAAGRGVVRADIRRRNGVDLLCSDCVGVCGRFVLMLISGVQCSSV